MIKIIKLNVAVFLSMFFVFVLTSKLMVIAGIKITGIEYIFWLMFVCLLFILNIHKFSGKITFKQTYFWLFLILVLFCFLNYFFVDVQLSRYLQGTFFTFLFAANFMLFYNIHFDRESFYSIINTIIFFITSIAVLIYLERLFMPGDRTFFLLRGTRTLAKDPGFAATLLNINIVLCMAMFKIKGSIKYLGIAAFSFATIVLLLFFKSVVSAAFIAGLFTYLFYRERIRKSFAYFKWVALILLLLLFIIPLKPFVNEAREKTELYFGKNWKNAPRNALYVAGFKIAKDYFPFGCGQGTFGSYPVGKSYSDIYYKYKLEKVHGIEPFSVGKIPNFFFDTYWSHILGEMGFIATFFYLWLWFFPLIMIRKYLFSDDPETKIVSFLIAGIIITVFIESIALSIPEQLQFIMIYAGLVAIAYKSIIAKKSVIMV